MKDLLIKAKLLLMPLWGHIVMLWSSILGKWNAFLVKLSAVEIPILKKKLTPRTIGVSIFVLIALIAIICLKSCGKEVKQNPIPVTTAQPLSQEIRSFATFDGLVDPYLTVNLDARVKGYLTKIGFADGAMVKKGDLLFVIEQDQYIQEVKVA